MANIGRDSADLLAGLQIDLLSKFRNHQVSADHLKWFLHLKKEQRDQLTNATIVENLNPWSLVPGSDEKSVYIVIQSIEGEELARRGFAPPVSETIVYLVAQTRDHAGPGNPINLGKKSTLSFDIVGWDPMKRVITVRLK